MRITQRPLQLLQGDVRVLMDQFDQEVVVGRQPSMTGVAWVLGGGYTMARG